MTSGILIFIALGVVAIAAAVGLHLKPQHHLFGVVPDSQFHHRRGNLPHTWGSIYCVGADHGLCRRHHGVVPVRDHAFGC